MPQGQVQHEIQKYPRTGPTWVPEQSLVNQGQIHTGPEGLKARSHMDPEGSLAAWRR